MKMLKNNRFYHYFLNMFKGSRGEMSCGKELGRNWPDTVICTVGGIKEGYRGLKKVNQQLFEENKVKCRFNPQV